MMNSAEKALASDSGHPQYLTKRGLRSLNRRVAAAVIATMALLFTMLVPITHSQSSEPNGDVDFEQIESEGEGGYIVQVDKGESATDVLADSDAVAQDEVEDLSGKAFNGAVADIDPAEAKELRADPRVVSVERDTVITVNADDGRKPLDHSQRATTSTQEFSTKALSTAWGLDRSDQRNLPLDSDYSPRASGSGVHIYVVDSGVDLNHPDFGGRIGRSAYHPSAGDSPMDCDGHGTHVAGTAASNTYGMAKSATIHSVRVLDCYGGGSLSAIISGLNWIAANAEARSVVNMSIGGSYSSTLNSTVSNLVARGIPVVVASGNEATDACYDSPASAASAITVGAVDNTDGDASFSNFGPCLDVYAPGVAIRSLLLDQPGLSSTMSGTSMAAPHVTGAIAVLWAQYPSLNGNQIDSRLLSQSTAGVVRFPFGQQGSPNQSLYVEAAPAVAPPPVVAPASSRVSVKLKSVRKRSKLRVDVNPNNIVRNYKIRVQKKVRGKWKTVRVTYTKGRKDRRTINRGKGQYRIVVPAQHGLDRGVSRTVRLRR